MTVDGSNSGTCIIKVLQKSKTHRVVTNNDALLPIQVATPTALPKVAFLRRKCQASTIALTLNNNTAMTTRTLFVHDEMNDRL